MPPQQASLVQASRDAHPAVDAMPRRTRAPKRRDRVLAVIWFLHHRQQDMDSAGGDDATFLTVASYLREFDAVICTWWGAQCRRR